MKVPVLFRNTTSGWTWVATWMGAPQTGQGFQSRAAAIENALKVLGPLGVTQIEVV